ncbi:MAG: helicase C-terminal domain-containing protein, partial [Candidatus Thorarchaeota archaeon]
MINELNQYNLPDKFQVWVKYQRKVVEKIVDSDKKYVVLRAPTGSGKSVMAVVAGVEMDTKTYYVVHNIQLQNQIIKDFPFVANVKGRANFMCKAVLTGNATCDPGYHCGNKSKCPFDEECDYKVQRREAIDSQFVVTNYAYFLAVMNSRYGGFEHGGLVILDEAHIADSALSGYVNFDISRRKLDSHNIRFPKENDDVIEWLEYVKNISADHIKTCLDQVRAADKNDTVVQANNKTIKALKTINSKVTFLLDNLDENWIINEYTDKYTDHITFVPVWVDKFSNLLLGHADRYLLMSATISKFDMELLGIDDKDMQFIDMPSTFDPRNMPVVHKPFQKINWKTNKGLIVAEVDKIVMHNPDEKGVIHTVSYELGKYILERSVFQDRMISHGNGDIYTGANIMEDRNEAIDFFLDSSEPNVLVSPSVETGLDLKDDLGRWQIIVKIPFASLGDEIVKRRKTERPEWYTSDAINRLVQGSGRICRSSTDHGTTYVLDNNISWLVSRNKDMFPNWWL